MNTRIHTQKIAEPLLEAAQHCYGKISYDYDYGSQAQLACSDSQLLCLSHPSVALEQAWPVLLLITELEGLSKRLARLRLG